MSDIEILRQINEEVLNSIERSKARLYKIRNEISDKDNHNNELSLLLQQLPNPKAL
jgi:hypothetical protein